MLDSVIRSDGVCPKCGSYLKSRILGDLIWFYCSNPLCNFRKAFRRPVKGGLIMKENKRNAFDLVESTIRFIKTLEDLIKFIADLFRENKSLSEIVEDTIKSGGMWEYRICSVYKSEEAFRWFRENMVKEHGVAGLIFKQKIGEWYFLHHLFVQEDKKELIFGIDKPYFVVKVRKIEAEFLDIFGDKDLLILN